MAGQWHPKFSDLLRPLVEQFYEVLTNVPVGDVPREADLVLLRRKKATASPFHGLWQNLNTWNVIEYKGPSVSARWDDLDLLVELGLGIHRRLNSERAKVKLEPVPASEVTFWYLVNRLGRKFLERAHRSLGAIERHGEGVWKCQLLDRTIFLVSGRQVPVEPDTLPLHLLCRENIAEELAIGRLVLEDAALFTLFGFMVADFHQEVLEELQYMARTKRKERGYDLDRILAAAGLGTPAKIIEQVGEKELANELRAAPLAHALSKKKDGVEQILDYFPPAMLAELKKRIEQSESQKKR